MLREWIDIQKKIIPDLLELLGKRYRIMQLVRSMQPIGRRGLAQLIGLTERVVRSEIEFLKEQGFIHFSTQGMSLTHEGEQLMDELDVTIREIFGLRDLEEQLQRTLSIRKVIIVPGDSSQSEWIKKDLGKAAVEQMKAMAEENWVVSVTGGTTMAEVAKAMTPSPKLKSLLFVPARGGLGENHENQANTICSKMAEKSGGGYRLLHVPDEISQEVYQSLINVPQIHEVLELIRSSRMIVHGIGEANTMAKKRQSSPEILDLLRQKMAVAEAFGYYFNQAGDIVHRIQTIGLNLDNVKNAETIIAVAGGRSKALAILAFLKHGIHDVLITDEGAAREIMAHLP